MKIKMAAEEFNKIMRVCTPSAGNDPFRPVLARIEMRCAGGHGVATALDGYTLTQCTFEYGGDDGVFLMKPQKKIKEDTTIFIEHDGDKVSICHGDITITERDSVCSAPYVDSVKIVNDALAHKKTSRICINKARLQTALKAFDNHDGYIEFEIFGEADPVIMRGKDVCGLVLPVRVCKTDSCRTARFGVETGDPECR